MAKCTRCIRCGAEVVPKGVFACNACVNELLRVEQQVEVLVGQFMELAKPVVLAALRNDIKEIAVSEVRAKLQVDSHRDDDIGKIVTDVYID